MLRSVSLLLVLLLAAGLASTPAVTVAQTASSVDASPDAPRTWLSFEGGHSTSGGFVGRMSANYVRSPHLFSLRFVGESPGRGFLGGLFNKTRSELGGLYGRSANWDWGHASVSTGVAVVWEKSYGSGPVNWTTVGVPLQATLYLTIPYRPIDWLGLKVGGHGNINPEDSFAGATVGLVIGKLR